uniref:Uncharacterized protein n=1 Tax=Salix viminalis TaxID=40686 RepID=A0A6N2MG41_SALVM
MGGVGKTRILQQIVDDLLLRQDISHHVYWVTVSQDFSIYRLQNLIARHLDLDLSSKYDILPRAAKLAEELMKKQEWILILDDLWESFELSAVGIPVPLKGCKVIFTTRSNAICQRMGSQVITKVRPLSEREAWTLFMETLGHGIALSPEVERIAADIARECAGLPLGIITMAGSLRGVDDQDEWRNTLEKLKELKSGDMEDEVFRMLRFSYDRLDDKLQQCLLYCTLFPEDYNIKREELIFYLIDEGIIQKMWSREAAFDKGHTMLDRLENAGLLQRIDGGRAVKMHDLVQRRKRIEMAPLKSGWTGAVSASAQEQNTVDMAQQREPLLTGEFEQAIDLTGAGIELPRDAPDDQDELKKLKGSKSRDMVDDFKSGLTGAVSASAQEQNNVDMAQQQEPLLTGEFEQAIDLSGGGIELPRDAPDDQDELKKLKGSKSSDMVDDFKSGWTLLMTNLILEIASAVFDQLGYALVGMVLAFVALLLATAELIDMARKERMSLLPSFHRPSTSTLAPGKPVGTIVEYFGLVGAVWQCFYSIVEYAYARKKKDNPIKMCLLPSIFILCVVWISNNI